MQKYAQSVKKLLDSKKITRKIPEERFLTELLEMFRQFPYENISKIIANENEKNVYNAFRMPDKVIEEHLKFGLGGTCFSLTYLFKQILDYCAFDCRIVLADRTYGTNTHCCIICNLNNSFYLVDPGYLLFRPVKLPESKENCVFAYGPYLFEAENKEQFYHVFSIFPGGHRKARYKISKRLVCENEFFDAWRESFHFDMMEQMIINCYYGEQHIYIRNDHFHSRSAEEQKHCKSLPEVCGKIRELGISSHAFQKAAAILSI